MQGWLESLLFYKTFPDAIQQSKKTLDSLIQEFPSLSQLSPMPKSYSQCLEEAKRELKYLLIYIYSPLHQERHSLMQDFLLKDSFIDYFKQEEFLFWIGDILQPEPFQVSQFLNIMQLPFLGVACLDRRSRQMKIIFRSDSVLNNDLLIPLKEAVRNNSMTTFRMERHEQVLNRQMMAQQEEAYQLSLMKDQLKQQKKEEEAEKRKQFIKEKKSAYENEEMKRKEKRDWFENEYLQKEGEKVRIQFRLMDGTRLEAKFPLDTNLNILYEYVEAFRPSFPQPNWEAIYDQKEVEDEPLKLQLFQSFPRTALERSEGEKTLKELGLEKGAALLVDFA